MAKTKVFTSFDFDHDEDLRNLLKGQAYLDGSPFEVADWSVRDPMIGDWESRVSTRIKRTDLVIVICGTHTDSAKGVSIELKIAQDENIPYFLLWGRNGKTCKKPKSAKSSDKIYEWTWKNLMYLGESKSANRCLTDNMPSIDKNILEKLVHKIPADTPYAANATWQEHVFGQYKLYVEMADRNSSRRQTANLFFLSINTAPIGLLGYLTTSNSPQSETTFYWIIAIAGIALNYFWYRIIRFYRDLNTTKFKVILDIEKLLPLRPYGAEWKSIGKGKDSKSYLPLTHIEIIIPWIFMLPHFVVLFLYSIPWEIFNFITS